MNKYSLANEKWEIINKKKHTKTKQNKVCTNMKKKGSQQHYQKALNSTATEYTHTHTHTKHIHFTYTGYKYLVKPKKRNKCKKKKRQTHSLTSYSICFNCDEIKVG